MAHPFLYEQARVRQRPGKCLSIMTQESQTLTACHHQRRHGDRLPVVARQRLPPLPWFSFSVPDIEQGLLPGLTDSEQALL